MLTTTPPVLPSGSNHFSRSWLFGAVVPQIFLCTKEWRSAARGCGQQIQGHESFMVTSVSHKSSLSRTERAGKVRKGPPVVIISTGKTKCNANVIYKRLCILFSRFHHQLFFRTDGRGKMDLSILLFSCVM